jgi:hypothetical protein
MREIRGTAAARLVVVLWALAAVALGLFGLARANPNAGLFLIAAGVLAGAGLVGVLTMLIQHVDGAEVGAWGYEREMLVIALLALSLAVPWRIEVGIARAGDIFGWSTPLSWLAALGLVPAVTRRLRRHESVGLAFSAVALAAWLGWTTWLAFSPAFRSLGFPFLPVDLLGDGWYLAVAAWAIAVDGAAARAAWEHDGRVSTPVLLSWAMAPGAGLVRLEHRVGGRFWLLGVAAAVFLLRGTGYSPVEFAYWSSIGGRLPPVAPRNDFTVLAGVLVIVWLASVAVTFWVRRRDSNAQAGAAQESG